MFNNLYDVERHGREHQQALLQAQSAQEQARIAQQSITQPSQQRTRRSLAAAFGHAIAVLLRRSRHRPRWLGHLLLVALALAVTPRLALAADDAGGTGTRSAVNHPGSDTGGNARIDPGSDTSLSAGVDPGTTDAATAGHVAPAAASISLTHLLQIVALLGLAGLVWRQRSIVRAGC